MAKEEERLNGEIIIKTTTLIIIIMPITIIILSLSIQSNHNKISKENTVR